MSLSSCLQKSDPSGANLLISDQHVLKIADFGLARSWSDKNPLTPTVITLWYRAPDILLGSRFYGSKADMWSIGYAPIAAFFKQ
jgi:serine/threonine protein kinase